MSNPIDNNIVKNPNKLQHQNSDTPLNSIQQNNASFHSSPSEVKLTLEGGSNICSKISFSYMNKVITLGSKKPYEFEDLYEMEDYLDPQKDFPKFLEHYKLHSNKHGIAKILWLWIKNQWVLGFLAYVINYAIIAVSPLLLKGLLVWYADENDASYKGWLWACGIGIIMVLKSFICQIGNQNFSKVGVRLMFLLRVIFLKIKKIESCKMESFKIGSSIKKTCYHGKNLNNFNG